MLYDIHVRTVLYVIYTCVHVHTLCMHMYGRHGVGSALLLKQDYMHMHRQACLLSILSAIINYATHTCITHTIQLTKNDNRKLIQQ